VRPASSQLQRNKHRLTIARQLDLLTLGAYTHSSCTIQTYRLQLQTRFRKVEYSSKDLKEKAFGSIVETNRDYRPDYS
jgi:hypothetical protein